MPDQSIFEKVDINGIVPGFIIRHTRPGSEIIKSHWHPELELDLAFKGTTRFFIEGRLENATPDHLVLVNSREVHSSIPYFPQEGNILTGITVQISYSFLKSLIPQYDECYFVPTDDARKKLQDLVTQLSSLYDNPDPSTIKVRTIGIICDIIYILLSQCKQTRADLGEQTTENPFQKLEGLLLYIHENYSHPLHTAEIAEKFGFSKEYFCRFFKKYTGATFHQYLTKCRILQAEKLLSKGSMKVSQIAQATGFSDENSFIQYFRKYYGCTPGNYRKELDSNPPPGNGQLSRN